jgi:hypothetical protein
MQAVIEDLAFPCCAAVRIFPGVSSHMRPSCGRRRHHFFADTVAGATAIRYLSMRMLYVFTPVLSSLPLGIGFSY